MESDIIVEEVDSIKCLGVNIDTHLNWKTHIENINNKISITCYALSILLEICSEGVVLSSYYGNVFSILTYGIMYWGNSVNVESTFRLQKRCLRTVFRMRSIDSLRNVFREKRVLTLVSIYILELCLFVRNQPDYFVTKASLKDDIREQYKYDLHLPRAKNAIFKKNAYVNAIRVYNHLPLVTTFFHFHLSQMCYLQANAKNLAD